MIRALTLFLLFFNIFLFPQSLPDTVYYENFENGIGEWTSQNISVPSSPSLWNLNTIKSVSPTHSIGCFQGTSYPNLSYQALVSPALNIPSNAQVKLSFDLFVHLSPTGSTSNDFMDLQVTTNNGVTWSNLSQYAFSGQQIGWKNFPADFTPNETGNLTAYAGKSIKIRFLVSTDNEGPNGEGIFIDNFRLLKTDCQFNDVYEPNNSPDLATPLLHRQTLNAALCPVGDTDFYFFNAAQNDRINITAAYSVFQITLTLYTPSGNIAVSTGNKTLNYNAATAGIYKLKVSISDIFNYTPEYGIYLNVINTKPDIISVTDIPNDQGKQVKVEWQYSLNDPYDAPGTIKEYHLFRKVDSSSAVMSNRYIVFNDEYWDFIATVPAISPRPFMNYSYTAPTLSDSTETAFIAAAVSKTSTDPVLWGASASGYSYDNIAPQFANFSVTPSSSNIIVKWNIDNTLYPDVKDVKIYKGMFQRFAPLSNSFIASVNPSLKTFNDMNIAPGVNYYYIISISDYAGNESITGAVHGIVTSVTDNNNLPGTFSLGQNYPNPFNPVTNIDFNLPSVKNITLIVYDMLGREVSRLADGKYLPGAHKVTFDGSKLTSGVYFYRLTAEDFSETKKLTILK